MSHQICAFLVAKVTQTLISEEYKCKIEQEKSKEDKQEKFMKNITGTTWQSVWYAKKIC